jgi:hypothetical protein
MEEGDIYYVDTRNATPARDHRTIVSSANAPSLARVVPTSTQRVWYVPGPGPGSTAPTPTWAPPTYPTYPTPPSYPAPNTGFAPNPYYGYGQGPAYLQPPVYGQPPSLGMLGALFGGINIGQVIDLVGQGFAALKGLPAAPSATGEVATDVANMTLYQRALAEHGKLDEQIRTGVHIVAKLLGA